MSEPTLAAVAATEEWLAAALLAGLEPDPAAALADARRLGVDPLEHFAAGLGHDEAELTMRAAAWAGLPFAAHLPDVVRGSARHMRTSTLSAVRALHIVKDNREYTCVALRFDEYLTLASRPYSRSQLVAVPRRALREALIVAQSSHLLVESRQRLARAWPRASASLDLSQRLRFGFAGALAAIVGLTAALPLVARPLLLPFLLFVIVLPAVFRILATLHRPRQPADFALPDDRLPSYTILVPLRDEAQMVPQLAAALKAIDYPAAKLEVMFLVEAVSLPTLEAVREELPNARFELVPIPDALPRTKPKALDFALPMVRGDLVVVFDAEDIPARDQLRRAAARFSAEPELACLQAELVVDNGSEGWLTALFAGEYAGLFGQLLPWLADHGLPLPLGGTSNHFRTEVLRHLGGWDAFNVTEDADLGLRLARLGHGVGTLPSPTAEEAPVHLAAWMRQRSRWMKGWMQTLLVHNRHPHDLLKDLGWKRLLFFEIHVLSLILSPLVHAAFVGSLAVQLCLKGTDVFRVSDLWDGLYLGVLIIGYGGAFGIAITGLARRGRLDLAAYQLLLPFYWLLHAAAAVRAAIELLVRPYHWSKTTHGQTRLKRSLPQP